MPRPTDIAERATAESRAKGRQRSLELRRERAKPVRQRFAEKLQAEADEIYESFRRSWLEGDWKAAQAALAEAFGRPPQVIEGGGVPLQVVVLNAFADEATDAQAGNE